MLNFDERIMVYRMLIFITFSWFELQTYARNISSFAMNLGKIITFKLDNFASYLFCVIDIENYELQRISYFHFMWLNLLKPLKNHWKAFKKIRTNYKRYSTFMESRGKNRTILNIRVSLFQKCHNEFGFKTLIGLASADPKPLASHDS